MNKRFYEFKNIAENEYSLYVYGEIVSEKGYDWWTGEKNESEVDVKDFKDTLAEIPNGAKLKMYVNSVGGSVFATSAIISLLQRAKDRGVHIDAYIDGLACSCASWLIMIADTINIYKNSVMMIHKPLLATYGNANDLQKDIEVLNKIEDGVIIPQYETKAKVDKDTIKALMDAETWLTATEIQDNFNVNFIDEAKQVENIKSDLLNAYKNTPKELKNKQEQEPAGNKVDYSAFETILTKIKGEQK